MAEFFGGEYILQALLNNPAVTALVPSAEFGEAIFNDRIIPATEEADNTINYYKTGPFSGGVEFFSSIWSIDCRGETNAKSLEIASEVFNTLNRHTFTVGGYEYFGRVDIGGTIPPLDANDVYNTPLTILIRRR